jgi:IS30 family transposase
MRLFSEHEQIAHVLDADIYFAHPYASWKRGSNENTNGLIPQYSPKGTDFNMASDKAIQHVMDRLNNRPRKARNCRPPNELFKRLRVDLLAG